MKTLFSFAFAVMTAIFFSTDASAHHSFAGVDRSVTVKLKGVVKEFQFTNPHVWVQLLVVDEKSKKEMEWALEGASPNSLKSLGWKKNSMKAGDVVTITINPMKDGSTGGAIVEVETGGVVLSTKY